MKLYILASVLLAGASGVAYQATVGSPTAEKKAPNAADGSAETPSAPQPTTSEVCRGKPSPLALPRPKERLPESSEPTTPPSPGRLPPDSDPRVQLASLSRDKVASREEELAKVLKRLGKALSEIGGPNDWDAQDIAMEEFQKLVVLQRKMASEVLDGYEQFKTAMAAYRKDLERAPEAYRQAAGYYRERAAAEENEFFRKNYTLLSENCSAYARLVGARRAELEAFLSDVQETVTFVEKTATFLKDFEDFVRLTPGLDTSAARREFRQQLKQYVKAFSVFQERFLEFSRKLRERAFSDDLTSEHSKTLKLEHGAKVVHSAYVERFAELRAKYQTTLQEVQACAREGRTEAGSKLAREFNAERAEFLQIQYREERLQHVRTTKAVVETPYPLEAGKVFPYMRGQRLYAGAAVVLAKLSDGRYEVEPLVGTFQEGDILLIKC